MRAPSVVPSISTANCPSSSLGPLSKYCMLNVSRGGGPVQVDETGEAVVDPVGGIRLEESTTGEAEVTVVRELDVMVASVGIILEDPA